MSKVSSFFSKHFTAFMLIIIATSMITQCAATRDKTFVMFDYVKSVEYQKGFDAGYNAGVLDRNN